MANILTFLLIFVVAATFGCDSGGSKPGDKTRARELTFVDSSKGLPSTGQWRHGLDFSDINGDGYIDIVAPTPRKAPEKYKRPMAWYGNAKHSEWKGSQINAPSDIPYDYGSISVSDFDKDGIPDVGLAMHSSGLKVLKGMGEGRYVDFSKGLPSKKEFSSRALVSGDFNNDGISDIAAVSEHKFGGAVSTGIWICYNLDNKWKCSPVVGKDGKRGLYADQIVAGDVNGDGNRDIAIGSLAEHLPLIVWLGDGKGGFEPFNKGLPTERIYWFVDLGDINKDGRDDLIVSMSGTGREGFMGLKAFLSGPDGFKEISDGLPARTLFTAVRACDINGDGEIEIVGGTAEGGLRIFSQRGNRWYEIRASGLPKEGLSGMYNLYCVDLNNDGHKDIAVNFASEKYGRGGIRVFLNRPDKG